MAAPVSSNVSVVVVSYNTLDKLRRCLSCIESMHEVIVVDNGSSDGSSEMVRAEFPKVRLIENSGNVGFGAANNQGMELASRELILFLNSDCYAKPSAIALLASALSEPLDAPLKAGERPIVAAGGKLLNGDESLQNSVANPLSLWAVFCEQSYLEKLFPRSRLFSPYWITRRAWREFRSRWELGMYADFLAAGYSPLVHVPQVMGACMMVRRLERFDERYFLYCEDTDLCRRLQGHGNIVWVPEAEFIHDLGSSSPGSMRWLSVARYNRGKELYFSIHHGALASAICLLLDRAGALSRLILYSLVGLGTLGRRRANVTLWWKVLTAPAKGPDRR